MVGYRFFEDSDFDIANGAVIIDLNADIDGNRHDALIECLQGELLVELEFNVTDGFGDQIRLELSDSRNWTKIRRIRLNAFLDNTHYKITAGIKLENMNTLTSPVAGSSSNYMIEVGKGKITGYDWEFITAENENVGTTDTILRDIGGTVDYPFPAEGGAAQWFVQSDDADDTLLGTGARTVALTLLEEEQDRSIFNEVIEIVNLNGTTSVELSTTAFRVNGFAVFAAGSSLANEGLVTLTTLTGGAGDILGAISVLESVMRQAVRTVPNGETWFSMNFYLSSGKADDVATKQIAFTPDPTRTRVSFSKLFVFEATLPFVNDSRIQFPNGFDLSVLAVKSTGSASGRVSVVFEFAKIKNINF